MTDPLQATDADRRAEKTRAALMLGDTLAAGRVPRPALHRRLFPAKFAEMGKSTAKRQIVGVVSQKGGVGKSTLCHLIAREAAAAGKQVKILDFDTKQMTSTDWVRARLDRALEPAIEAEAVKNIGSALKHNRRYDIIVLDGAAGTPKRTAELASACDLIVLPTGSSRADLVPTLALARRIAELKDATGDPVFALCRISTESEAAEARATIGEAGFETLEGELVERPGYRQAQNIGRSATETGFPSLNDKARRLARAILDRLAWERVPLR